MANIYLVNVGANTSHSNSARSPRFPDGSFVYVPFPDYGGRPYNHLTQPFVQAHANAHDDPDWVHLTYGDGLYYNGRVVPRAAALANVRVGDILLFWALLWDNNGNDWAGFGDRRGWYLIGALRVSEIAEIGQGIQQVSNDNRERARHNIHFSTGQLPPGDRVFIGDCQYSALFTTAVDLQVNQYPNGLLYRAFRSADGRCLHQNVSPRWWSSLRSCRMMFSLENLEHRCRAELIRDMIREQNHGFDLLADL